MNSKNFRIITFNANGIRSAQKKGFFSWFAAQDADVLCMQELKAQEADIPEELKSLPGYRAYFHCAQKRGYSGCGIWCRREPDDVVLGFGSEEFDAEGRYAEARFGDLSVISCYFPSGSSSDERQAAKFRFLDVFSKKMDELAGEKRRVILCGDLNIAHKEIDIKNWKGNLNHSGFLPEERAWMSGMLSADHGWVDVFRRLDPRPDQYTWWSQRGQARAKNVGWRIDYQLATPQAAERALATSIYPDEKFSDHAPLTVDYGFEG